MRLNNFKWLMFCGVLALGASRIDAALAAGVVPGEDYAVERNQLLAAGWKPNTGYGLKLAGGRPMHRFPEVLCGMDKCRAKWRDPSGAARSIMMQRGGPNDPYIVTNEE
ncbi:MAG TPA: hypothetical protein VMU18_03640 [Rhodoblastus sp.]|nr:hypothetical protein [Rhodoblastus sp.]